MFNVWMSLYIAALFFILTPGVLLRLPSGSSRMVVAATHAVVFALVYHFTHNMVWNLTEGFSGSGAAPAHCPSTGKCPGTNKPCKEGGFC